MTALIALKPFQIVEELATSPLPPHTHARTLTRTHTIAFAVLPTRGSSHCFSGTMTTLKNRAVTWLNRKRVHSSNSFPAQSDTLKAEMKGRCHLDHSCTVHDFLIPRALCDNTADVAWRTFLSNAKAADSTQHEGAAPRPCPSTLTSDQLPRSVITSALHSGEGRGRRDVAAAAPSSSRPPGTPAPH